MKVNKLQKFYDLDANGLTGAVIAVTAIEGFISGLVMGVIWLKGNKVI